MERNELENEILERDALDGDRKLAELLTALPRVEAPANFEFGVRARIKAAEERIPQAGPLVPFLKLTAPLSLVLLVTAFVVYYATLPAANTPAVVEKIPQSVPASSITAASEQVAGPRTEEPVLAERPAVPEGRQTPEAVRGAVNAGPRRNSGNRSVKGGSVDVPLGGGSEDRTLEVVRPITPPGIPDTSDPNDNSGPRTTIREVFDILGVKADHGKGIWKVSSISDGSVGRKLGLQAGDEIESINGTPVTENTSFKVPLSVKTFRVRREGKSVDLKLAN